MQIICPMCQKEFLQGVGGGQVYCSRSCKQKRDRKNVQHTFYKGDFDPKKIRCSHKDLRIVKSEYQQKEQERNEVWINRTKAMLKKHPDFNFLKILLKELQDKR